MKSIRSSWPTAAHPLGRLSDRRIAHYVRLGYYGRARQEDLLRTERVAKEAAITSAVRDRRVVASHLSDILNHI